MASVSGDEDETSREGGGGVGAEEGKRRERRGDDDWEPFPRRGGSVVERQSAVKWIGGRGADCGGAKENR
jgi:hypothetical protein